MLYSCRILLRRLCKAVASASGVRHEVIKFSNEGGEMSMEWGEQGQTETYDDKLECMGIKGSTK